MFFDTHAHLDDAAFDDDRDQVIRRAAEAGVDTIVAVGTTAASSEICAALAARSFPHAATERPRPAGDAQAPPCGNGGGVLPTVAAAVGIQPNCAAEAAEGDWDRIVHLCDAPGVVALGETGLDLHWDFTPLKVQQDYFQRHLALAAERDLPVVVHTRDCDREMLDMLGRAAAAGPIRGVMHSFTGDPDMAKQCLEVGLMISFAGMVTFKKSDALRRCAATIPDDRILIETDSPYLSPHPVRSQRRNEPANVRYTAACLAEVRGVPLEVFARQTSENARRLFGTRRDGRDKGT